MREKYIDIAKGIGIWSIVFLHYENGVIPWWLNSIMGYFMITIFYVTAGWIMAMKDKPVATSNLFRKRLHSLGKPYLYWSIIILTFDIILYFFGLYDSYFVARETFKFIILRGIGTLWFLPALMGGELLWNWLKTKKRSVIVLLLLIALCYRFSFTMWSPSFNDTVSQIILSPFRTIANMNNAWIHIAFGYYLYKGYLYLVENKTLFSTFSLGVVLFISGILSLLLMCDIPYFSFFSSIFASALLPSGLLLLCKAFDRGRFWEYWGRNSLSLMVTHYSITMVIIALINQYYTGENFLSGFSGWISIGYFFISIPIQYLMSRILQRIPVLIGK